MLFVTNKSKAKTHPSQAPSPLYEILSILFLATSIFP